MSITTRLFQATSAQAPHPQITVDVPVGYKIIGGGAIDNWPDGVGNMLTAAYPQGLNTWFAAGKDHEEASPATITGFAIAIHDPQNEWDVVIESATSAPAAHPSATATLPAGYVLTGGGAFVNWTGAGNLLTASFPSGSLTWEARSKDHDVSDPAAITAYAIGIRHRSANHHVVHTIVNSTGNDQEHPTATACVAAPWILSGGGAIDNWNGAGNLLTGSAPQGNCWTGSGKDHIDVSPATITAFAIGIREV